MDLGRWIADRRDGAIVALKRSVSATDLVHERPGFDWRVRPAPGSILASPRSAHWDPDPDYFHHWIRDAAVGLKVWPDILAVVSPGESAWWRRAFDDHIVFSLAISDPERRGPAENPLKSTTGADFRRFLRPDSELAALSGAAWLEEPRMSADGTADLERWARPQDDGPALRATAILEVTRRCPELRTAATDRLVLRDLAHLVEVAGRPSIGPWEEEPVRRTSFALIAAYDALTRGAQVSPALAPACRTAARRVAELLEGAVSDDGWTESVGSTEIDTAALLAILHAGRMDGVLALTSPRTLTSIRSLETLFGRLYPINRGRSAPAIGRWAGDVFFGGNPWFPVTLGFAELHYRLAALTGSSKALARGDRTMELIREVAPDGEDLPEQFDRDTGAPVSCKALTWSAAAFIAAAAARQAVVER